MISFFFFWPPPPPWLLLLLLLLLFSLRFVTPATPVLSERLIQF